MSSADGARGLCPLDSRAYAASTKGLRPLDSQDAPHPLSAFGAFPFMGGFYPLNNCEGKFYQ